MQPSLSPRGHEIVWVAFVFLTVGALTASGPIIMLGGILACALGSYFLLFLPRASLLRKRCLEMAWWLPRTEESLLVPGRPFPLRVLLRNRAPYHLGTATLIPLHSGALAVDGELRFILRPLSESEVTIDITARATGTWFLHGARLVLTDRLGLFAIYAYFPNPMRCTIFPRTWSSQELPSFPLHEASPFETTGLHRVKVRGMAGELKEIREYTPQDPFKHIAWKATARTGRLMVRELEREIIRTHEIILDASPTMRAGSLGRTKLDFGIELVTAMSRAALARGDRVGVSTFDSRILNRTPPASRHPQILKVIEHLLDLRRIVDEDVTDSTDGEVCARVAEYIRHQYGIDLRVESRVPITDPRWPELIAGPGGELYDLETLARITGLLLSSRKTHDISSLRASSPAIAQLRFFCREHGIEIPYRRGTSGKAHGLSEGLSLASFRRTTSLIVVISDLEGLSEGFDRILSIVRRAIRKHRLMWIVPFTPGFAEIPGGEMGEMVGAILTRWEQRVLEGPRRALVSLGIPVLFAENSTCLGRLLIAWEKMRTSPHIRLPKTLPPWMGQGEIPQEAIQEKSARWNSSLYLEHSA